MTELFNACAYLLDRRYWSRHAASRQVFLELRATAERLLGGA